MWEAVVWWRAVENDGMARTAAGPQRESPRLIIASTALAHLGWHVVPSQASSTLLLARPDSLNHWLLAPVVILGLAGAWRLLCHHPRAAAWCFLLTMAIAVAAAT